MAVLAPEQVVPSTRAIFWTRFPARSLPGTKWSDHIDAHRAVMRLFPVRLDGPASERRKHANILFRIDILNDEPVVMVQSSIAPEMMPIGARSMQVSDRAWEVEAGGTVRFRIAVRAVRRNPRAKTEVIVPAREVEGWFTSRIIESVSGLDILNHARYDYRHDRRAELKAKQEAKRKVEQEDGQKADKKAEQNSPALIVIDMFDCVAQVADVDAFNRLRVEGLGRSKAYGAGLLTAQRIG